MKRPLKTEIRHRINAARVAVTNQVSLFKSCFGKVTEEWKADGTRVTFADLAISEKICAELQHSFPNDDLCSEESGPDQAFDLNAEFAWILDPIDGTNNYFFGITTCGISLGLLRNGEPIYGFIYDLSRDRLIEGGPGFEVLDGGKKATVKPQTFSEASFIAMHFPLPVGSLPELSSLLTRNRIRSIGSSALNLGWTAIGKVDGCVDYRSKVWDIAGGYPIVLAAGGLFRFISPSPFPLKRFDVASAQSLSLYAGTPSFMHSVETLNLSTPKYHCNVSADI